MSLSERFKRLPEEQLLRNEESARQAREASELLKRVRSTRQEAEKVAKEEIDRTRRIQREEVEMHPEVVELKKRLRNAERDKEIWERKQKDMERAYQIELDALKRDETNLVNRFNYAQEEEMKFRHEQEKILRERQEKEQRLGDLENQFNTLKREEETQFIGDVDVLKNQIKESESSLPSGDFEAMTVQLKQIENEIRNLQDSIDDSLNELKTFEPKERQAAEDLLEAQRILKDAKDIEEEKKRGLESIKGSIGGGGGYESAQRQFIEAENHLKDIEGSRDRLKRDTEICSKSLEEKSSRIQKIREEIQRLQEESSRIEMSQHEDYNKLYDLENRLNRHEIDLKDAKDHFSEAKNNREFYLEEKMKSGERIGKIEQEIVAAQKARQEAEAEEKRAMELCDEIGKRCNDLEVAARIKKDRVEGLNQKALELQHKTMDFDRIKTEIGSKQKILNEIQTRWTQWKVNRLGPLQQDIDNIRSWLSSHPKNEAISTSRSTAAWNELERVRNRIKELKVRCPTVNFEDPDNLRSELNAKEEEIKNRLAITHPASQRYLTQLEREAEALMRAEVAATHEKKQEAIDKEASELSKLRLSLKPQVALDEEAKRRLWRLNEETGETGVIADQVLELCQSRNITLKQTD